MGAEPVKPTTPRTGNKAGLSCSEPQARPPTTGGGHPGRSQAFRDRPAGPRSSLGPMNPPLRRQPLSASSPCPRTPHQLPNPLVCPTLTQEVLGQFTLPFWGAAPRPPSTHGWQDGAPGLAGTGHGSGDTTCPSRPLASRLHFAPMDPQAPGGGGVSPPPCRKMRDEGPEGRRP